MENNENKLLFDLTHLKSQNEITDRFKKIANKLLTEYQIQKGSIAYDILEIEFYYYSEEHPDIITYPRTAKAGHWYFHMSGVDIAFESNCHINDKGMVVENDCYGGGILIRSIRKGDSKEIIVGPMNCVNELFDTFDALKQPNDFPTLVPVNAKCIDIDCCKRWIPPFPGKENPKCSNRYQIFANRYNKDKKQDWDSDDFFVRYLHADYRYFVKDICCRSTYSAIPKGWSRQKL